MELAAGVDTTHERRKDFTRRSRNTKKSYPERSSDDKCYLVIEHEAAHYVGSLIFDDIKFCRLMFSVFKDHIGRSIEEIGDVDLSYTL